MEGNPRNYPHGAGGGVRQARARRRGMMMVWNMPPQPTIAPMIFAFSPDTKLNFWSRIRKPNNRIKTPLRPEDRRQGQERGRPRRSRWSPYQEQKKKRGTRRNK